jgi:transposase
MPAPISEDLRRSIIRAWKKKRLSGLELAELFGVGEATVKRLKRKYRETGSVAASPHGGGVAPIIGTEQEPLIEALVQQHPDWSEDQYSNALLEQHGIRASAVTVGRAVRRLGYSVKKRRSSPKKKTVPTSSSGEDGTSTQSKTSPLRVWFSWTKPARTAR